MIMRLLNIPLIALVLGTPQRLAKDSFFYFEILNVGQGSWSYLKLNKECIHLDVGGEKPLRIPFDCLKLENKIFLTHFDWDHIQQLHKFQKRKINYCVATVLPIFLKNGKLKKFLQNTTPCKEENNSQLKHLYQSKFKKRNESHTYLVSQRILVTGDLPANKERLLPQRDLLKVEYLVVGHHGSRTSSDWIFLQRMKNLKVAIVSSRKSKYGHPHPEVVARFAKLKIPLLTTEDFGHIRLQLLNL